MVGDVGDGISGTLSNIESLFVRGELGADEKASRSSAGNDHRLAKTGESFTDVSVDPPRMARWKRGDDGIDGDVSDASRPAAWPCLRLLGFLDSDL